MYFHEYRDEPRRQQHLGYPRTLSRYILDIETDASFTYISDWESYGHHKVNERKGDFTPLLMNILSGDFDMYHISPNTESHEYMNAPITTLTFFLQPHGKYSESASNELFSTTRVTEGCRGLTWGAVMRPPRRDPSGFVRNGKRVITIAGWETPEHLEVAMRNGKIAKVMTTLESTVAKMV